MSISYPSVTLGGQVVGGEPCTGCKARGTLLPPPPAAGVDFWVLVVRSWTRQGWGVGHKQAAGNVYIKVPT